VRVNSSHKGRRAEHRARALLEAAGFHVCRAAASKGPADLVAWNDSSIRFISVKSGTKYASATERDALRMLLRPANASVEIWRFPDRCPAPLIERL
jgi:Holliday junction resolvase